MRLSSSLGSRCTVIQRMARHSRQIWLQNLQKMHGPATDVGCIDDVYLADCGSCYCTCLSSCSYLRSPVSPVLRSAHNTCKVVLCWICRAQTSQRAVMQSVITMPQAASLLEAFLITALRRCCSFWLDTLSNRHPQYIAAGVPPKYSSMKQNLSYRC